VIVLCAAVVGVVVKEMDCGELYQDLKERLQGHELVEHTTVVMRAVVQARD